MTVLGYSSDTAKTVLPLAEFIKIFTKFWKGLV